MANEELRQQIKKAGVLHWEIAERLRISPYTLCIWLRRELNAERKSKILQALEELKGAKNG